MVPPYLYPSAKSDVRDDPLCLLTKSRGSKTLSKRRHVGGGSLRGPDAAGASVSFTSIDVLPNWSCLTALPADVKLLPGARSDGFGFWNHGHQQAMTRTKDSPWERHRAKSVPKWPHQRAGSVKTPAHACAWKSREAKVTSFPINSSSRLRSYGKCHRDSTAGIFES